MDFEIIKKRVLPFFIEYSSFVMPSRLAHACHPCRFLRTDLFRQHLIGLAHPEGTHAHIVRIRGHVIHQSLPEPALNPAGSEIPPLRQQGVGIDLVQHVVALLQLHGGFPGVKAELRPPQADAAPFRPMIGVRHRYALHSNRCLRPSCIQVSVAEHANQLI